MKNRPYLVVLSTTHIIYSLTRYLSNMKHILSAYPTPVANKCRGICFYSFPFYSIQGSSFIFIFIHYLNYSFTILIFFLFFLHVFHIQVTVSL